MTDAEKRMRRILTQTGLYSGEDKIFSAELAAYGVGLDIFAKELERLRRSQHVFRPLRDEAACAADYRQWKRAVERSVAWAERSE